MIAELGDLEVEYVVVAPSFDGKATVSEQMNCVTKLWDEVIP